MTSPKLNVSNLFLLDVSSVLFLQLTAFSYWFEAANRGHPGAILSVGEGVSSGEHVEKNCPLGIV